MYKYHFDIKINETNRSNAGTKATEDCRKILLQAGFKDLELFFKKSALLMPFNLAKLLAALAYYIVTIKPGSFVVVQYPLKGVNNFFGFFVAALKKKSCRCCCIIHDLDSLRNTFSEAEIKKEINRLNAYDGVISHNESMTAWLRSNGYQKHIEEIGLFDYLVTEKVDNTASQNADHFNKIVFAGNLGRGNFLPAFIATPTSLQLELYGVGFNRNVSKQRTAVTWHGSFSTEEIVHEISGDFGLVWDGDSTEEIDGLMGNYQRYNTPHKTSLYIAAGLPVIVSENAAIANYISTNQLGFTVKSLSEIEAKISEITTEVYQQMKANVQQIQAKLISGAFLNTSVNSLIKALYES